MSRAIEIATIIATGEEFDPQLVARSLGVSESYVGQTIGYLKRLGFHFSPLVERRKRCLNPDLQLDGDLESVLIDLIRTHQNAARTRSLEKKRLDEEKRKVVRELREKRESEKSHLATNGHTIEAMKEPTTLLGMPELHGGAAPVGVAPELGSTLQVFAMVLEDDGSLRIGIQDNQYRWVAQVIGQMER